MAKREHKKESLVTIMSSVRDPRVERTRKHEFCNVLIIGLCSMVCGHGAFTDMETFGRVRKEWFGRFLDLGNGIPSHDTFRNVFSALDTGEFLTAFMRWTSTVCRLTGGEVVGIDGKALRRAKAAGEQAKVIVGAWGTKAGLSLGQVKVDEKGNEITALPELLDILDIKGCVVTIDAMGCQKEVAKKIVGKGADYVLALKANQGHLHDLATHFLDGMIAMGKEGNNYHEGEVERGHGRVEIRRCWACGELGDWLPDLLESYGEWEGLRSIAAVECERTINGETTVFRRYFITSLPADAEKIAAAVRDHWGIENSLHWVLDMAWREDESRARAANAAENLSTLRRLALNVIKADDPNSKLSVNQRMITASGDPDYLARLIGVNLDA